MNFKLKKTINDQNKMSEKFSFYTSKVNNVRVLN